MSKGLLFTTLALTCLLTACASANANSARSATPTATATPIPVYVSPANPTFTPTDTPTPDITHAYLYTSDSQVIYLDFASGIAINLEKDTDYINGNACWKLQYENDLTYSWDGNRLTIKALYVEQFVPFVIQPDGSLTRDEVDQATSKVIHQRFVLSSRDGYNSAASQFESKFPKCS